MSRADRVTAAIQRTGRTMTLKRPSVSNLSVLGVTSPGFGARDRDGGLVQGDAVVTISNSEIAAGSWPGPPKPGDTIVVDGRTWAVRGSEAKYLGATVVAHVLTVRGG